MGEWYPENELLPLSALQHLVFCERQCALIHLEQVWMENQLTAEGRLLHQRTDSTPGETRRNVHVARGVALHSLRLGLSGKADTVEFHRVCENDAGPRGVVLPRWNGLWRAFPVEYKRGRPKLIRCDEVQLCAQALCLEEMLGTIVSEGALFYGKTKRRKRVVFEATLRKETEDTAARLHKLIESGTTPPAVRAPKCDACSLLPICLPDAPRRSARRYLERVLHESLASSSAEEL